jgi:hypothetical protein
MPRASALALPLQQSRAEIDAQAVEAALDAARIFRAEGAAGRVTHIRHEAGLRILVKITQAARSCARRAP